MPRARKKAGATLSAVVSVGAAAADTFRTTIGALRADLEIHRHRVVEIETLIAGLESYGVAGENLNRGKRRAGRPPANAGDELRQRKARNMRSWRARQVQTPPKARARKRRRKVVEKSDAPQDQPHGGTNMTNDLQVSARDTEGETLDVLRKVFDEQFKKIMNPSRSSKNRLPPPRRLRTWW